MKHRMGAGDRRLAIIKAALPLFAQNGFAATTTRQLARAARISEPLLYKHFPSKEALYCAIQEFGAQSLCDLHLERIEPSTSSLVHLLYVLMRMLIAGQPGGGFSW